MTVIDTLRDIIICDSDTGPGTVLINAIARQAGLAEGFDRDGSFASTGVVDLACLEHIAGMDWFLGTGFKTAQPADFEYILQLPQVVKLALPDRMATLAALTARTIFNYFKNTVSASLLTKTIWLSGGGANNLTIANFLSSYFSPLLIKSVVELGIPVESRVPLSLALTVVDAIDRHNDRKATVPMKWILP
jgi:anhydro-N-acetylmuramic acid kinase